MIWSQIDHLCSSNPMANTFDPTCLYPESEYFWLNTLHPTPAIHNATAFQIAQMLSGPIYPSVLQLLGF